MGDASPAVEFDYRLAGPGWSEARLAIGDASVELTASYLGDALGELMRALVTLAHGAEEARCGWEEEPGEYRWLLARTGDRLRVRILAFGDVYGHAPDEEGRPLFDQESDTRAVIEAVVAGAERILAEHGTSGYREEWIEHDFPVDALRALRQYLAGA